MSENIRKAVEYAAKAYCYESGECPCAEPGDCHLWQGVVPNVASAIAAFLKSYADEFASMADAVSKVLSRETKS